MKIHNGLKALLAEEQIAERSYCVMTVHVWSSTRTIDLLLGNIIIARKRAKTKKNVRVRVLHTASRELWVCELECNESFGWSDSIESIKEISWISQN